jgi:hypothetical protein
VKLNWALSGLTIRLAPLSASVYLRLKLGTIGFLSLLSDVAGMVIFSYCSRSVLGAMGIISNVS